MELFIFIILTALFISYFAFCYYFFLLETELHVVNIWIDIFICILGIVCCLITTPLLIAYKLSNKLNNI